MSIKSTIASLLAKAANALTDKPAKEERPIERLHNEIAQGVKALEADRNEKHKAAKAAEAQFESNDAMLNRATALARRAATLRVEANVAVKMTDEFKQLITQQEQEALDAYCDMQSLGVAHLVSVDEHQIEEDYRRSFASRASSRFASRSEAQSAAQSAPPSAQSAPPSGTSSAPKEPKIQVEDFGKLTPKAFEAFKALVDAGILPKRAFRAAHNGYLSYFADKQDVVEKWAAALMEKGEVDFVRQVADVMVAHGYAAKKYAPYASASTSASTSTEVSDVDDDETDYGSESTINVKDDDAGASGGTSVLDSKEASQTRRGNPTV